MCGNITKLFQMNENLEQFTQLQNESKNFLKNFKKVLDKENELC